MTSVAERLEGKVFLPGKEKLQPNEIPSIAVFGENLPEAWENALLATWEFGTNIPTEYDQEIDPESRDATMMIVVADPFREPRIHKAPLVSGLEGLCIYTNEVVAGVHDHWVKNGGWSYSYHDRLTNWPGVDGQQKIEEIVSHKIDFPIIDQLNTMLKKLAQVPHTRRAQAITWNPLKDRFHHEPPCLQRVWCRVVKLDKKNLYHLEMNTHWRSRDGFKAAFMNMYALTELQRAMAAVISQLSSRNILPGRYVDISDSFHISGSYIRKGEMGDFLKSLKLRSFKKRTYRSDDEAVQAEFAHAVERLKNEAR